LRTVFNLALGGGRAEGDWFQRLPFTSIFYHSSIIWIVWGKPLLLVASTHFHEEVFIIECFPLLLEVQESEKNLSNKWLEVFVLNAE
jgi:hypothetical protein